MVIISIDSEKKYAIQKLKPTEDWLVSILVSGQNLLGYNLLHQNLLN